MEADLSRTGLRLRDICRPFGDPRRLTLRELHWRFKHTTSDSPLARSLSDHGFSLMELLVMESGFEVNPRHPGHTSPATREADRVRVLKERTAHYRAVGARQAADDQERGVQ